jgi:biopolymer transport protein ExbB
MVKCFYAIEQKISVVGLVNPSDLAGGIWEALLTTVAGLCVAIPSYIAYNYFIHRLNSYVLESERAATELLEVFSERRIGI